MVVLSWVAWGLSVLINLYMMVLFARVILEWIPFFVRGWRPRGILLVVANVLCALTDPRSDRSWGPPPPAGSLDRSFHSAGEDWRRNDH